LQAVEGSTACALRWRRLWGVLPHVPQRRPPGGGLPDILLRNWPYFERSPRRTELFGLLGELVVALLDSPLTDEQFSLLLRALLMWCTQALGGQYARSTTSR